MKKPKYSFTIMGNPITKLRPRFSKSRGKVRTYSTQADEAKTMAWQLKARMGGDPPLEGPLKVAITFVMPIPKSASKCQKAAMLTGAKKHTKKPDCDNLVKMPLDCMNGVVYVDDKQIFKIVAEKQYGDVPRTEIIIICEE